jgi:hypothetical protein
MFWCFLPVETKMTDQFKSTRRVFMMQAVAAAGVASMVHAAQAAEMVSENDTAAKNLGYRADATKVDKAAQPKYAAGQHCGSCQLFQGKASDASGPCPLFGGKNVSAKGWCSAYAKKA